jgi:hypothetical protein
MRDGRRFPYLETSVFSILGRRVRLCDGITRREALRIGGLGFTGLLWSDWLRARAAASQNQANNTPAANSFGKAKACILIFNYGGPSHLDIWDLKPGAPQEIRGEFQPASTSVPGTMITQHLPRLGSMAHQYTIIRSVNHIDNDHAVGTYLALTGYGHPRARPLGVEPPATPQDMPSLGSVVSKLRPTDGSIFPYVTLGDMRHFGNNDSMGQNAGCLGRAYDPFTVPFVRPSNSVLDFSGLASMLAPASGPQMEGRLDLLGQLSQAGPGLDATTSMNDLDGYMRSAVDLLSSAACRDAFNLERESQNVRDAYGPAPFAQSCLLSRRLVEAGVPLVTVYSANNRDWDTHGNNFNLLRNNLLPPTDQGVSALLEDLQQRGMLEDTLVVWMGDMGRTPRINGGAGRDHWSFCYSIVMTGGGVRRGQVYGSSDRDAAYPSTFPVSPADIAATIYHCLGINPRADLTDQQGRPIVVSTGTPVQALLE